MVMLQHKLNLKVSQKQVLTPGLVQMVNVLALNKMELLEMINNEIVENPVLEELDENVPILDDAERNEEPVAALPETADGEKTSDPFDEIDFGTYFQEYLDPGFRTPSSFEMTERPSFENFLSRGATLMDHLQWQLGAMSLGAELCLVTDMILGNLDADGYLTASEAELLEALKADPAFQGARSECAAGGGDDDCADAGSAGNRGARSAGVPAGADSRGAEAAGDGGVGPGCGGGGDGGGEHGV